MTLQTLVNIHPNGLQNSKIKIYRTRPSAKDENAVDVTQVIIPGDRVEEVSRLRRDESAQWPHRSTDPDGPPVAPIE